jgi:hypothetical protein
MTDSTMTTSGDTGKPKTGRLSNRYVRYFSLGVMHSGYIVGFDDEWCYVKSDSPSADESESWHFRIKREKIQEYLVS